VTSRSGLTLFSLAAFAGGGLLAPAAHLAWHRPGHSHGPGGVTVDLGVPAPPASVAAPVRSLPAAVEGGEHVDGHLHRHAHPHRHGRHDGETAHATPEPARGDPAPARKPPAPDGPATEPLEVPHGHGSLAHFGLALLPAPPPVALPAPSPIGYVADAGRVQPAALRHPDFPLSRPPPETVRS
jgi:hypothetical protein